MLETSKQLGELYSLHCSVCCIALCACWNVQLLYAHAIVLVASVLPEAINWIWTKLYWRVSKFLLSKIEFALSHGIHTSHSQKGHPNHEQKASQIHNPGRCASSYLSFFCFSSVLTVLVMSLFAFPFAFYRWHAMSGCTDMHNLFLPRKPWENEGTRIRRSSKRLSSAPWVCYFYHTLYGDAFHTRALRACGRLHSPAKNPPFSSRLSLPAIAYPQPYNNHQMNFVTHVMECNSL